MRWRGSLGTLIGFSIILLLMFLMGGCRKHAPPKAELCGYHEGSGLAVCNDPRRNPEDYTRTLRNGDLITSPGSFERSKAYCAEMRTKLIKCENKLRNRPR